MQTIRKMDNMNDEGFVRFIVLGPRGATQMVFLHYLDRVMAADFGYHSPRPMYEGHESMECDVFGEVPCYYDGSGLRADRYLDNYLGGDYESIYIALENEYDVLFGEK